MKKNIKREDKKKRIQNPQTTEPGKTLKRQVQEMLSKLKAGASWKSPSSANESTFSIGIDIGDKKSRYCILDAQGGILAEDAMTTTREEFAAYFSSIPKTRIAIEVGTHSPWIGALLESYGHMVYVANPRKMESIHKNRRKNDKVDARTARRFAQEQFASEQRKFKAGTSTLFLVLQRQTTLVTAQSSELRAQVDLAKATADFDRATGRILKAHNVVLQPLK